MLRWTFLLLLLVNAIVLLWAAMMRPDQPHEVVPPLASGGRELQLLSEVDAASLKLRPAEPDEPVQANLCLVYEGFADRAAADQAAILMRNNGLEPLLETETEMQPDGFELVLDVPASSAERLSLIERLDTLGVVPEGRPEDGVLKLGRFTLASGAEPDLERYAGAGLVPLLKPLERPRERVRLLISASVDRNLFNKINRVLENTQPEIKIEKKVCEGVASTRGGQ